MPVSILWGWRLLLCERARQRLHKVDFLCGLVKSRIRGLKNHCLYIFKNCTGGDRQILETICHQGMGTMINVWSAKP